MMTFRVALPGDELLISEWITARGYSEPGGMVPPLGAVAEWNGAPVAAVWAYEFKDVPMAMLDWLCSRPGLGVRTAREALTGIIRYLHHILRQRGVRRVLAQFEDPRLVMEAEKVGFAICGPTMVNMTTDL